MKKWLAFILSAVMALTLAACGSTGGTQASNPPQSSETEKETEPESDNTVAADEATTSDSEEAPTDTDSADAENNILVVYFSWSGNLHKMAGWIADETGGDLVRVTAAEAYPEDYSATADRAKSELDDGIHPEINVDLTEEQFAQYDTVFFGFPVWWYDLPMPMWTLLESYDFSDKTVIPFFSHEGSSNGANALPTITELAGNATVQSDDALSIRSGNVADSEEDVRAWVRELEYGE